MCGTILHRRVTIPRTSRCSTADTKNVPPSALEAGNSAATIFSHYRALASESEGTARLNLLPPEPPANVTQLRQRDRRV